MPDRFLLLRHGQSTWNAEGRWQGTADPPLSELGEAQAAEAADRLAAAGLSSVVASDLTRAMRTAEILAERLDLGGVLVEPSLREFDVGDWCGLTRAEIGARWPVELERWNLGQLESIPGGETRAHFRQRILEGMHRLAADSNLGPVPVGVVHGGVLRALEREAGVETSQFANLSGRWFTLAATGRLEAGDPVVLVGPEARTVPASY